MAPKALLVERGSVSAGSRCYTLAGYGNRQDCGWASSLSKPLNSVGSGDAGLQALRRESSDAVSVPRS